MLARLWVVLHRGQRRRSHSVGIKLGLRLVIGVSAVAVGGASLGIRGNFSAIKLPRAAASAGGGFLRNFENKKS